MSKAPSLSREVTLWGRLVGTYKIVSTNLWQLDLSRTFDLFLRFLLGQFFHVTTFSGKQNFIRLKWKGKKKKDVAGFFYLSRFTVRSCVLSFHLIHISFFNVICAHHSRTFVQPFPHQPFVFCLWWISITLISSGDDTDILAVHCPDSDFVFFMFFVSYSVLFSCGLSVDKGSSSMCEEWPKSY